MFHILINEHEFRCVVYSDGKAAMWSIRAHTASFVARVVSHFTYRGFVAFVKVGRMS